MAFIDRIKDRARQDVKKIVMPESNDRRTLIAAHKILKENIADIIMVGKEEKIMEGANWLELDLSRISVVDPETSDKFELYADTLYELRKNKGMTPEKARERLLSDYLMWGVMMVKMKDAIVATLSTRLTSGERIAPMMGMIARIALRIPEARLISSVIKP